MASAAKALVGGTSLLLAMADGRLRANEPASKYIPSWREHPQKSKITIRHLATHTSGLEDSSVPGIAHPNEPGWKGRFWKREPDPFTIAINEAPLLFAPGQGYEYSNPGMAALAYAVTQA
jgi:CubicO group peptidase (beta-lactamase class C family)